jgi:serine protease Do/serine protease DegQ
MPLRWWLAGIGTAVFLMGWSVAGVHARVPSLDEKRGVMTMAPVLELVTPAVVSVSVLAKAPGQDNPLLRDPFFRKFFEEPGPPRERQTLAAGSGVIIDAAKGHVVTNSHMVRNALQVVVTDKDGRRHEAKIIGSDPGTDIALLKIDARDIGAVQLADSDELKVGDLVMAIGNPFGLGQTVTQGIVSALGRSGLSAEAYEDFIQTDAPINPGNSGGALVNTKGELIGINTAIIAPGGGNIGIGFAVPANVVKAIVGQIEKYGEVRRGRLGVSVGTITPDVAASLGLPSTHGALVAAVEPGSPAERAGLKPNDAIIEMDGRPVRGAGELRNRIGLRERGSKVQLIYMRERTRHKVEITITGS